MASIPKLFRRKGHASNAQPLGSYDTTQGPESATKKVISTRQFIFTAMGGTIGAGLLIASGPVLKSYGPGNLLFGYLVVGFCVSFMMGALNELASTFPTAGSFYDYSLRFISPSWGFAMGWNWVLNFMCIVPLEITVLYSIIHEWLPDVHAAIIVAIIIVLLMILAAFGANWYGEVEHAFGILKVFMLVAFTMAGIVIASGGVPTDPRHGTGFKYWQDGNAFKDGGHGFLEAIVAAGLAFGGTEILGLTAVECKHPQRAMRLAYFIVPIRIVVCYLIPLFVLGLVYEVEFVSLDSPFVRSMETAGIRILPHIFRAIILCAVFSMANSCIFASSRALRNICARGMGPKFLAKTTKRGVPMRALAVVFSLSLLAFVNVRPNGSDIFYWLLALGSVSNYITWGSIGLSQIRMLWAFTAQGQQPDEVLQWRSPTRIWGSVLSLMIVMLGLASFFVKAFYPEFGLSPSVETTLQCLLGFIVVFTFWVCHMAYSLFKGKSHVLYIPLKDIDLTNPAEFQLAQINAAKPTNPTRDEAQN
ncbi:hypothetical protein KJ359_010561 [Pestalotiopsis sp. 9143b]|nr:hypothetical protein KJ359_010561 [Pestalotiopsis sp. 9143b]